MKTSDVLKAVELAEHFLRSSAARSLAPLEMAERWAAIHRLRAAVDHELQSLSPITATVPKPGVRPDRHERVAP